MNKGRNITQKISKYIVSGVLLFSILGAGGCNSKKIDELAKQIEELKEQISTFESLKAELEAQLADAQAINAQLTAINQNKDLTIDELTANVETLQNSVNALNVEITNLNTEIDTIEGEKGDLENLVDSLQHQKEEAQALINELNCKISDLEAQIHDLDFCTVTFDYNYEVTPSTYTDIDVKTGEIIGDNRPEDPERDGYNFVKWVYGDLNTDWDFDNDKVSGDITLKAIWNAKTFTVTYKLNGGSFVGTAPSNSITYDTMFTLPNVSRTNYTLSRWTYNGNTFTSGTWKINSNVTLECEWAKTNAKITYTYNYPERDSEQQNVTYNSSYTLQQPTREGYTFLGWKYNGSYIQSGTWKYLDDIEVLADWTANTYTLTLDSKEGVLDGSSSATVTFDSSFSLPKCFDLDEDRPFAGWFIGNKRITDENGDSLNNWTISSDQTLEAKYFHAISNKDEFLAISENPSTIYGLVNDIDFENTEAESIDSFSGTLIGLGYSIKNVSFVSDSNIVGLFKQLNGATFEDISFTDSVINFVGASSSTYYIGLLAAQAYGDNVFKNVFVNDVDFDIQLESGLSLVGGLVGIAENLHIEDTTINVEGEAKSPGNSVYFGGFVGECDGLIEAENYEFGGHIASEALGGTKDTYNGGLVGLSYEASLTDVRSSGIVAVETSGGDAAYSGGIIGKNRERTEMLSCYNAGVVLSNEYSGGLIGYNSISASKLVLDDCYNSGDVSDGLTGGIAGGLIGRCSDNVTLTSVYNSGRVITKDGYSGGLVGSAEKDIMFDSCYSVGMIGALNGTAGGLVGQASSVRIFDSYSLANTQGDVYVGGLVGEATKVDITKSYVGGRVHETDSATSGFVGGFIGKASNSNLNNSFIFAEIVGFEENTNSYAGKADGCVSTLTYSASSLKSKSGDDISESTYPSVTKIEIASITAEFIQNTLQFSDSKWNIEFDYTESIYPTLKCFE